MDRGRGDAALGYTDLTEGETTALTPQVLPPGARPSTEWEPWSDRRREPEADPRRDTGPGSAGAEGTGEASWRRRLAPRHREVVQRFFETR